ncbi:hypothetical protein AAVH_22157 [Aphelenchoides avenae]|nr:hypothetical protein AAVH_22157 [Aphelenchus avenae]
MERYLKAGPLAGKLNAEQWKAFSAFVEANKKLKRQDFCAKLRAEFLPTLPADIQAMMTEESWKKRISEFKAKEAGLSEPAKAVCGKSRALRENMDITIEEECKKFNALFDSAEYKAVVNELKANGYPVPN